MVKELEIDCDILIWLNLGLIGGFRRIYDEFGLCLDLGEVGLRINWKINQILDLVGVILIGLELLFSYLIHMNLAK